MRLTCALSISLSAVVETLYAPSEDDGALDVFVEVFTGDPGPRPEPLAQSLAVPIKVIWGALDSWTPADGTVARAFRKLAATKPQQVEFDTIVRALAVAVALLPACVYSHVLLSAGKLRARTVRRCTRRRCRIAVALARAAQALMFGVYAC